MWTTDEQTPVLSEAPHRGVHEGESRRSTPTIHDIHYDPHATKMVDILYGTIKCKPSFLIIANPQELLALSPPPQVAMAASG